MGQGRGAVDPHERRRVDLAPMGRDQQVQVWRLETAKTQQAQRRQAGHVSPA